MCHPGPQIAYSHDPLIVDQVEKEQISTSGGNALRSSAKRMSWRAWMILITLISVILTIGVGVGVGVGVEVSKKKSVDGSAQFPTPTSSNMASMVTSSIAPTRCEESPFLSIIPDVWCSTQVLEHGILNDSSFAAVASSDGSKYVFFQDISGTLRQAFYSQTAQSWTSERSLTIPDTTDARIHTPLSAIIDISQIAVGEDSADQVYLKSPVDLCLWH